MTHSDIDELLDTDGAPAADPRNDDSLEETGKFKSDELLSAELIFPPGPEDD